MISTAVVDADGATLRSSTFTYDSNGNHLSSTTTRTLYVVDGTPLETETQLTEYVYDAGGRVIEVIHPDGVSTYTDYNSIGKQSRSVEALGRETFFQYNNRGNPVRTVYPDSTEETATYDLENRRISSPDRKGNTTYFVYDALGRMTDTILPDATMPADPAAVSDPLGEASLADNPVTSTVYDAIGRVEASFDERGQGTFYDYDTACGGGKRGQAAQIDIDWVAGLTSYSVYAEVEAG